MGTSWMLLAALALAPQGEEPKSASAAKDAPTPTSAAAASSTTSANASAPVNLSAALADALRDAKEPARVALLPIDGANADVARQVESQLLRGLIEAGLEPITIATVQNVLGARAMNQDADIPLEPMRQLAADHILVANVVSEGAGVVLKLLHVESGVVLARKTAILNGDTANQIRSTRAGVARLVDEIVVAMAQQPGELRLQRVAVAPFASEDENAQAIKLDRFIRAQVEEGLLRRGLLVVEREKLSDVGDQLTLGINLGEENAPKVGRILGAQAFVFGSIAGAGDAFLVTARVVDANSGKAVGAATAKIRREGAVTLASGSMETRTPAEALFRSAVAPGWGQAYNQQPVKSVVFGGITYGALAASAGLLVAGAIFAVSYDNFVPAAGATPDEYAPQLRGLRETANALFITAGVGAGVAATAWGVNVADAYFSATE